MKRRILVTWAQGTLVALIFLNTMILIGVRGFWPPVLAMLFTNTGMAAARLYQLKESPMKKVRRKLDGKVYVVHGERPVDVAGIEIPHCYDVLVRAPRVPVGAMDVLVPDSALQPGMIWLDGFQVTSVPDYTPEDYS